MKKYNLSILITCLFFSSSSLAGGFEINNLWSARYSAVGGAAASSVEGAQSVYFNPAGLSKSKSIEIDLNFNTFFYRKSGPVKPRENNLTVGASPQKTPIVFVPVTGMFGAHQVNRRLGLGAGFYFAGGSGGRYEDIEFGNNFPTLNPDIESTIVILEFGVGAGYQLTPGLSAGLVWRPSYISLSNKSAAPLDLNADGITDVLLAPEFEDLSAVTLGGFKFGLQYRPVLKKWGIGLNFRSENKFTARGKTSGSSQLAGSSTISPISGGDVAARSKFPMQIILGAHYDYSSEWRFLTQYDYTRNERVQKFALKGHELGVSGIGSLPIQSFTIPLEWRNQHSLRFGVENRFSEVWTLRAGYVHSTQITPEDRTSPVGTPPGSERSYLIGGGRQIILFNRPVDLDLALEYINASGHGKNSKPGSLDGRYDLHAFGLFMALRYRM